MTHRRQWTALIIAAGFWISPAIAQQSSTSSTAAPASSTSTFGDTPLPPAASSFGTPSGPSGGPPVPGTAPGSGVGPTFGTSPPNAPSSAPGRGGSEAAPATESSRSSEPAPEFSVPGSYGQGTQLFTFGEGRLARPKFRYTASLAIGYDDNVLQTPTDAQGVPDQVVQRQVTAGTPAQIQLIPIPVAQQRNGFKFRAQFIPAVEPTFEKVVIPGVPAQERIGSLVTRGNLGFEVTFASRRTLFTFDAKGGGDYYWDRPGKATDPNASLALIFLRRLTPRAQFTANISGVYLSQPDFTRINSPTQTGTGSYLNGTSKFDLSYRWAPRFSTVSSAGYNTLLYQDISQEGGNFSEAFVGTEARFVYGPRVTLIAEGRYSMTMFETGSERDSHSVFALVGGEFSLSRRLTGSIRLGEVIRTFETGGQSASSPYFEGSLSYLLTQRTVLRMNTRFGFEESGDVNTEVQTFRLSTNLNHAFTARLRGSLSGNYIHRSTTNDIARSDLSDDTFDVTLGLDYALSRKWSFNTYYTFTTVVSSISAADYYRNRIFIGASYDF